MKLLDGYILKKYLSSFFFVVALLVTVICVIDYTEKNEDFLTRNVPIKEIFFTYYLNFIPYIANMITPITVFIATVFVTSRLAARTELVAMLNSGISFARILVPYIAGSVFIATMIFYLTGWVIPRANKIRHGFENVYVRGTYYYDGRNVHFRVGPNSYAYFESYNNIVHTGYQFTLEKFDHNQLVEKISSPRIFWESKLNKWRLEQYTRRTFQGDKETIRTGASLDTVLKIQPKDFETHHMLYEQLTYNELNRYIAEVQEKGLEKVEPYFIEKYKRITYPFAIIILTIIGVIVSARKTREGTGFQIAIGFFLAFVYIVILVVGESFANSGSLDPRYSSWIPNLIFSLIGIFMYSRVPK